MSIPHGWKLVPVEPTPEMLEAAFKESVVGYGWIPVHYRAMLDAAPTPPVQQDDEALEALRALRALVEALENAFISSWQSTAAWQEQRDSAHALLTKRGAA